MAVRTCSAVSAAIANSSLDPQSSISSLASKARRCASPVPTQPVDALVAGNGENPCGDASPCRVEPVGLAPHRQHGFLRQIFRKNVREAVAHQKPLHPRGEVTEQVGEGGAVPVHAILFNNPQHSSSEGTRSFRSAGLNVTIRAVRGAAFPSFFPDGTPASAMTLLRDETLTGSPRIDPE